MKHNHTKREKGQALFLAALMVLSVFAMSASFAGAAAATATGVTLTPDTVNEDDDPAEIDIEVTSDEDQTDYAYAIVDDADNVVASGEETIDPTANSHTFSDVDVSGLEAGGYTVFAEASDGASAPAEGEDVGDFGEAQATLTVEQAEEEPAEDGSISGTVTEVDDDNGDAIEGATVTAVDEDGNEESAEADGSGDYEIENLADGSYTVTAGASGFVSASEEDVEVSNGAATSAVDFALDAPSSVFVDQISEDGTTVTVDEVYLPEDGFVAIHSDPVVDEEEGISPADSVVGVSEPLDAGTHTDVEVTLFGDNVVGADFDQDSLEEGQLLHAMPHLDEPNDDEYRFVETFNDDEQDVEDLPFFDQDGEILGMDNAFVSIQDGDAVANNNTTYWQGQDLFFQADDGSDSAEETFQLRTDDDDESLVTEFSLDENGEATITGETNVAPGTEMEIRNRASGGFLMTENVEIQSDGAFEGTFDFSAEDVDTEFVSQLIHDDDLVNTNAIVVESTEPEQDPHTVTITVEDADGEPVSGAEVEVSNDDTWTETTDANGEAVFELAHGEYDVTATHDGEEASGSLTVDDETPDSGTLTLGEEDQQIPEEDDDGVDDGVDDYDDADDGVDDDAAPDDDGANADDDDAADDTEDQPGFGIAVALIALLAAAGIALRNRA